jgi:hypothetical protein
MESLTREEQRLVMGVIRGLDRCPAAHVHLDIELGNDGQVGIVALRKLAQLPHNILGVEVAPRLLRGQRSTIEWFRLLHRMQTAGENWNAAVAESKPDFAHLFDLFLTEALVADRMNVIVARRAIEGEVTLWLQTKARIYVVEQRIGNLVLSRQFRFLAAVVAMSLVAGIYIDLQSRDGALTGSAIMSIWNHIPLDVREAFLGLPWQAHVAFALVAIAGLIAWSPSYEALLAVGRFKDHPARSLNQVWSNVDAYCQRRGAAIQRAAEANYSYELDYELMRSKRLFLEVIETIFTKSSDGQDDAQPVGNSA